MKTSGRIKLHIDIYTYAYRDDSDLDLVIKNGACNYGDGQVSRCAFNKMKAGESFGGSSTGIDVRVQPQKKMDIFVVV